jgi:hypothetical protein
MRKQASQHGFCHGQGYDTMHLFVESSAESGCD